MTSETSIGGENVRFQNTLWTLVLRARESAEGRQALGLLLQQYWKPIYFYLRRQGHSIEDAKDLTQGFCSLFLEKRFLARVGPEKGRFRNIVLVALNHYVANEARHDRALKRGGGIKILPINFAQVREERAHAVHESAERVFEREWALAMVENALTQLRGECEREQRAGEFQALYPFLLEGTRHYDRLAVELNVTKEYLARPVALKILSPALAADPDFKERFIVEAQVLAKFSHPNIVTIHDFGERDGFYYLVMEYVEGTNLRQILDSRLISREELMKLVPPLCEALEYAHTQGVVHRDIKPENILVDKYGQVKITDFGLAKMANSTKKITQVGVVMGTPHYMAPEQLASLDAVDHRADLYSLGAVIYEILTGSVPAQRYVRPSRMAKTDPRMDRILERALHRTPEARYQTAAEIGRAVTVVIKTPAPPRRWWMRGVLAALLLVATGSLGYVKLSRRDTPNVLLAPPGQLHWQDGACYKEGAVHLKWGATFGHLQGKELRIYRRVANEEEQLIATTKETSYVDKTVKPNRLYSYHIVLIGPDGRENAPAIAMEVSTIVTRYIVGEVKIHYGEGSTVARCQGYGSPRHCERDRRRGAQGGSGARQGSRRR